MVLPLCGPGREACGCGSCPVRARFALAILAKERSQWLGQAAFRRFRWRGLVLLIIPVVVFLPQRWLWALLSISGLLSCDTGAGRAGPVDRRRWRRNASPSLNDTMAAIRSGSDHGGAMISVIAGNRRASARFADKL